MTGLPIDSGNARETQDTDFCIAQHVEKIIMKVYLQLVADEVSGK
jgi:hypothetical protein